MPSDDDNKKPAGGGAGEDPRQARLARALRDNLKKRKAQQRQRQAATPDEGADDKPGDG